MTRRPPRKRIPKVRSKARHFLELPQEALGSHFAVLGIDPDTHNTGLAFLRQTPLIGTDRRVDVRVARVPKDVTGFEAAVRMAHEVDWELSRDRLPLCCLIVVEGQDLYRGGEHATKNAESIVRLAFAAGGVASVARRHCGSPHVMVPSPQEWKGSVDKQAHQGHTYRRMGWEFEKRGTGKSGYAVPINPDVRGEINPGDWKHVGDALGLALWGLEQISLARAFRARQKRIVER